MRRVRLDIRLNTYLKLKKGLELATNALYTLDRNYQNDKAGEAAATLALRRATDLSVTKGEPVIFTALMIESSETLCCSSQAYMWKGMYNMIGKCNDIIEAGKKLPETDKLNNLIAQAKAFPGTILLFYFIVRSIVSG